MLTISNGILTRCSREAANPIEIPTGVKSIGDWAFYSCAGLTSIVIPAGVVSIGDGAFSGCTGLTSIAIPAGVTLIDWDAFSGCTGLTSIVMPDGVTSIGSFAFSDCTDLVSIAIPGGVASIGYGAFSGCTDINQVIFDKTTANIPGSDGFTLLDRVISSRAPANMIKAMILGGASFTDKGLVRAADGNLRPQIISWCKRYQRDALYNQALQIFYAGECEKTGWSAPNISRLPLELWLKILGLDAGSHPEFPLLEKKDLRDIADEALRDAIVQCCERPFKESLLYGYNDTLHCLYQLGQEQVDAAKLRDWRQAGGSTAIVLKP